MNNPLYISGKQYDTGFTQYRATNNRILTTNGHPRMEFDGKANIIQ